jgi:hypothetical protein
MRALFCVISLTLLLACGDDEPDADAGPSADASQDAVEDLVSDTRLDAPADSADDPGTDGTADPALDADAPPDTADVGPDGEADRGSDPLLELSDSALDSGMDGADMETGSGPPRLVGQLLDGTVRDVAATDTVVWLAQGRILARLDPETGARLADDPMSPFAHPIHVVEHDAATDQLVVASHETLYLREGAGDVRSWDAGDGRIFDVKLWPADDLVIALLFDRLVVLDSATLEPLVEVPVPDQLIHFARLELQVVGGELIAWATGQLASATSRGTHGIVTIDLDRAGGFASAAVVDVWEPIPELGVATASARCIQVLDEASGDRHYAYVATAGAQLVKLDVTTPAEPAVVATYEIHSGFQVFNLVLDPELERLYVASTNLIHIFDTGLDTVLSFRNVGFYDAGERDMALAIHGVDDRRLWTGTHHSVEYVIKSIQVGDGRPSLLLERWWISSSDGGLAVPEWNSLYLPTFGGVARYDVTDPTEPRPVEDGYQPAGGTIEHIDIVWPDLTDPDNALLLTAPGDGGVQWWPVSASEPNPAPPTLAVEVPASWGSDPIYQNDVTFYQRDGETWLLADLANRRTGEVALQVYSIENDVWLNAFESSEQLDSNAKSVVVSGDFAFVTCHGGFFAVDLSGLPDTVETVAEVIVDLDDEGTPDDTHAIAFDADGTHLFVATDNSRSVASYGFDSSTGAVTGPLSILTDPDMPGTTAHGRYHAATQRLYIAGRRGTIIEVDASDPNDLRLLSLWSDGAYTGEMQDVRITDFGRGPRVLAITNNQGFAILDPDDGL